MYHIKNNYAFRSSIEALENKLNSWNEFDILKESCLTWLRETDYKIHAIDLKNSLQEKKTQLEELKVIIQYYKFNNVNISVMNDYLLKL